MVHYSNVEYFMRKPPVLMRAHSPNLRGFCFSYDMRGKHMSKPKLWSAPNAFGPRAIFQTITSPAELQVDNLSLNDEGVYRCRVDFRNSPTRNLKINLSVIGEQTIAFIISLNPLKVHIVAFLLRSLHSRFA